MDFFIDLVKKGNRTEMCGKNACVVALFNDNQMSM